MNRKITICIIGIITFSALSTIADSNDIETNDVITEKILISTPLFTSDNDYINIHMKESISYLLEPGKPCIPIISKTFSFPLGTKIADVDVIIRYKEYVLEMKIQPATAPQITSSLNQKQINENIYNETLYNSSELYPSEPYILSKDAGLENEKHVLFLNLKIFPQYSPVNNIIYVPEDIDITIEYNTLKNPLFSSDQYDMLIIANQDHIPYFERFINHKNNLGIKTIIESVENIYSNYEGIDEAEDIKLQIKDAIEEYGITYVLLAGGRKGQTLDWYIPDREISNWESGRDCSSDHYFADIYAIIDDEVVFDDWDSNNNGLFAESSNEVSSYQWDKIDYYPDVVVGRLPFRYEHEIEPLLDKIIWYETTSDKEGFHNAVVVSGDQYPPSRGGVYGIYEGEMETNVTATLLENKGFNVIRLWQSTNPWEERSDIIDAVNVGLGFVHFACHGSPISLGTYPSDDEGGSQIDVLRLSDIRLLDNSDSLPVVMVHGCHTAQFSVALSNVFSDIAEFGIWDTIRLAPFLLSRWAPIDITSAFMMKEDGGAIASLGYSGYGYFWGNEACMNSLCPWICTRFFDAYVNQSIDIIGKTRDQAIVDYLNLIGGMNSNALHRNTIEGWILMGDPSLKIGGFDNSQ